MAGMHSSHLRNLNPSSPAHLQFVVRKEGSGKRSVAGVDWVFNAWGGEEGGLYATWDKDQAVAGSILQVPAVVQGLCRNAAVTSETAAGSAGAMDRRSSTAFCRCAWLSHHQAPKPSSPRPCPTTADGGPAPLPLPHCDGGRVDPRGRAGHAADHRRVPRWRHAAAGLSNWLQVLGAERSSASASPALAGAWLVWE